MHPYHQAEELIGKVYIHPISNQLVVFVDHLDHYRDPILKWRSITGDKLGRVLLSTVLKGDGRWIKYEGRKGNDVLPYSHRS